jgi:hypothetical protein
MQTEAQAQKSSLRAETFSNAGAGVPRLKSKVGCGIQSETPHVVSCRSRGHETQAKGGCGIQSESPYVVSYKPVAAKLLGEAGRFLRLRNAALCRVAATNSRSQPSTLNCKLTSPFFKWRSVVAMLAVIVLGAGPAQAGQTIPSGSGNYTIPVGVTSITVEL